MRRDARYLRGWDERRPGKWRKFLAFMAFAGAAAAGYAAGDWSSQVRSAKKSAEAIAKARHHLGAAICAAGFMRQADAQAQLTRLVQASPRDRSEQVARGGWATMPDRDVPDAGVAALCAARLGEVYTSVRKATPISSPALPRLPPPAAARSAHREPALSSPSSR